MLPEAAEFVIIGGGVMGVSTAYHLLKFGAADVVLLERDQVFGAGATGRCAGGVRYQFATDINVRLSLESLPMLERFEAEIGQPIDYRKCGYMFLLTRQEDVQSFENSVAIQQRYGIRTSWLEPDEIKKRLPMMQLDDVIAATFNPDDGLADPNSVVLGYLNAAKKKGLKAITNAGVTKIERADSGRFYLSTPLGTISASILVDATGPWSKQTGEMAGLDIPVSPVRRQWLTTSQIAAIPDDFPFVIDFAQSLYFHREGPGLLTGMSNPHEPEGVNQEIDPDWEMVHIDAAINRLPSIETAGLISRTAGLYENSPDAHPIIGKTPLENYFIITGFSGHGFMHGPIAGKLLAEIILYQESRTVDISILDLARFSEGRLIQEYNVV